MIKRIDLNCDLGEGYDDTAIMPYISSCSIACGGHYGNSSTMREAIIRARDNGLSVGAHPSYPDKENFGRRSLDISSEELSASISKQLNLFTKICDEEGVPLHHVKPHGALYNDIARNMDLSSIIIQVIADACPSAIIYGAANSHLDDLCQSMDIEIWEEVFVDRRYENRNTLVSRQQPDAVITDEEAIIDQLERLINNEVKDIHDNKHEIAGRTICLHSDTKGAERIAKIVHQYLVKNGVEIN